MNKDTIFNFGKSILKLLKESILIFFSSYRRDIIHAIRKAKEDGVSSYMNNYDRKHAKIAIQELIANADSEVILLCHRLSRDIYEDEGTIAALNKFFSKDASKKRMEVFVRDAHYEDSLFVDALNYWGVTIHKDVKKKLKNDKSGDICYVDGHILRIESDSVARKGTLCFSGNKRTIGCRRELSDYISEANTLKDSVLKKKNLKK